MKLNYKKIGEHIRLVDERNKGLQVKQLLGLSISKQFIPSVANIIGTDMENYKIIRKNQFACSTMQVRRDKKMPVALLQVVDEAIISQAYPIFEVKDPKELLPEYLMMWFTRSEFDREACFHAVGGVRGSLEWEDFENLQLPIPHPDKQKEIVKEYNIIQNRIDLNQQLIQKLEETAQAIYREWFVEGIDIENLPDGWRVEKLKDVCTKIGSGSTPTGGKESYFTSGISLIRSTNIFDYNFSFQDLAFISLEQADKLKNVEVKESDILFNITGVSVARCSMVPKNVLPARVNQHVMIIRPDSNLNISFYLLLNLCSTDSKNALLGISQSGSTREAITKSEIEDFQIVVPGDKLLQDFEKQMSKLFLHKDMISLESQKLTELKDLLLSKLATIEN
ncbi:MAG: restriction endonuclease subunit S [Bacteroidetes bacterium]|nr:restriction endonuclease subunit S [Bacteroidota bacterium]